MGLKKCYEQKQINANLAAFCHAGFYKSVSSFIMTQVYCCNTLLQKKIKAGYVMYK